VIWPTGLLFTTDRLQTSTKATHKWGDLNIGICDIAPNNFERFKDNSGVMS